jgi:alkaline phosphatase D
LGEEQRNWLLTQLSTSTTNWQVLGSQVLMGKYFLPAEMLALVARIASSTATDEELFAFNGLVQELATIKGRIQAGDPSVTAQERARVETVLPYNLDAWDGYPVEREVIYEAARGKKLVSIAGDTHNAWHSKLTAQPVVTIPKEEVGTEFATASVSSPGLEAIFGGAAQQIAGLEAANVLLMDDLQYLNAADRGYLLTTFTATEARAEWRFIATLATPDTTIVKTHAAAVS